MISLPSWHLSPGGSMHLLYTKLALVIVVNLFSISTLASPGDLDENFGRGGKIITDFFGRTDAAKNLIIDANGKILISGSATKDHISDHFALARYDSNGVLDATFDADGKVT